MIYTFAITEGTTVILSPIGLNQFITITVILSPIGLNPFYKTISKRTGRRVILEEVIEQFRSILTCRGLYRLYMGLGFRV